MYKKILSFLLIFCMLCGTMPMSAFASESNKDEQNYGAFNEEITSADGEDIADNSLGEKDEFEVETLQASVEENEGYAVIMSSTSVNSAVQDYIDSLKNTYPEGSVWNGSYDDGSGKAFQCFGFAMLMADKVFGCPPQRALIRNAANGAVSNGWTCYHVNANNCSSLSVEPGDLIDATTDTYYDKNGNLVRVNHTAMVASVAGSNIVCVQCNYDNDCKVYWTSNFNYNSANASLSKIYSKFGGKGTVRLWKPSEELKNAVAGRVVVDTEAPKVGDVSISNESSFLTFRSTATDNIGIVSAWAIVTAQNGASKRFEAIVSGNQIYGTWSNTQIAASEKEFTVTVYAQDAAGNIGSNAKYVNIDINVTISPKETTIEVGEKARISVKIDDSLYTIGKTWFSYVNKEKKYLNVDWVVDSKYSQNADIEGIKPGADRFEFEFESSLMHTLPNGDEMASEIGWTYIWANVHVIPNAPTITSIELLNHQYDRIHYTPVDFAETYDLYRLREGTDSDYQLVTTFKNDGSNSYTIEHPADGSTYFYKMTAKAEQTTEVYSNEVYYPTSRFSNVITSTTSSFIPTNVSAVSNRDNEIKISWNEVTGASGYEIYRYTKNSEKELVVKLDSSQTSYLDTDVNGGITYYYDIYAVDIANVKGDGVTVSCVAKGFYEEKIYYTVTFQSGFKQIMIENEKVEKGKHSLTLSSSSDLMKMEGYEFIGWYTKQGGAGECYTSETQIMSDITLYAYWKEKVAEKSGKFWVAPIGDQKYTGKAIKPEIQVYDGDTLLVQGTDYTVSYKNNVKVCNAKKTELSKAPSVIVKGKKNYSDSQAITFSIVAIDLNDNGITVENMAAAYTGKDLKPVPVVYYNGKKLKYNTDYIVSYPQSIRNVGQYSIQIIGTGGYTGERTISVTISDKKLLSNVKVSKIANQVYNGTQQKPTFTVKYGNMLLKEDTAQNGTGDYTVRYINNRNIGTATVVLSAVEGSEYIGTKTITFKITGTPISKASATLSGSRIYNGGEIKPQVNLLIRESSTETKQLTEGVDYSLAYSNNVNAGTAKILITGRGKYTGSKTVTFKITPYDLSKLPAKANYGSQQKGYFVSVNNGEPVVYQKGKAEPPIAVSYSDYGVGSNASVLQTYVLTKDDYKVSYKNTDAISAFSTKKPQILITGKGNYKGTIIVDSAKFEIVKADLSTIDAKATDVSYSLKEGNFAKTKVTLYDTNGKKLTAGKDYDQNFTFFNVTNYITSKNIGNGMGMQTIAPCNIRIQNRADFEAELKRAEEGTSNTITLLDKNGDIPSAYQIICVKINALDTVQCNYNGTAYAFYRISTSAISKCKVKVNGTFIYNGKEQILNREDLTVTIGSGNNVQELVYGRDYIIDNDSYKNNKKVGTANVYIYGIGDYYGMKKVSFRISAKKFLFF